MNRWAKDWRKNGRYQSTKGWSWPHPIGYCGDQMCCWGEPGDRVQWPRKKVTGENK